MSDKMTQVLDQLAALTAIVAELQASESAETHVPASADKRAYDTAVLWRALVAWAARVPGFEPDRAVIMTGTVSRARKHKRNFAHEREAVEWFGHWLDAGEKFKHEYVRKAQQVGAWDACPPEVAALFSGVPSAGSRSRAKVAPSAAVADAAMSEYERATIGATFTPWDKLAGKRDYERVPAMLNRLSAASKAHETVVIDAPSVEGVSPRVWIRAIPSMLFDSATGTAAVDYAALRATGYAPIVLDGRTYGYVVNAHIADKPRKDIRIITNDETVAIAAALGHIAPDTK